MDEKSLSSEIQPVGSAKLVIVQGVVQNLPVIVDAIKEIYKLNNEQQRSDRDLQSRLYELNVNKESFKVLVENLTELSKSENTDAETKAMYRDMIRSLFETFTTNLRSSQDFSNYLEEL